MTEDYAIYIGGKPFMNYVTAVVMQFTTKGANQVVIRARGKFISRAIDVAEVVRSRFLKDQVQIVDMQIDSEEFKNKEGREVRVSTLDVFMSKITEKSEKVKKITPKPKKEKATSAKELTPKSKALPEEESKAKAPTKEEPTEPAAEATQTEEAPQPETASSEGK